MAYISRDEFIRRQKERQERSSSFDPTSPRVGYFKLNEDGDEAIVRFAYSSADELYEGIFPTHQTSVDGKFRRVRCLRESYKSPISDCPMCAAGIPSSERFYIKLVEYTKDESGEIVATPKIWERSTSYVGTLNGFFEEYGDISDMVFKVRRIGKKGDLKTTYSVLPANQKIYNESLYPKDLSGFNGYDLGSSVLLNKSKEEMAEMVGSSTEEKPETPTYQTTTPRRVTY